jgi:hypothetical protein
MTHTREQISGIADDAGFFMSAWAEQGGGTDLVPDSTVPSPVLAELCRIYLAWLDAPNVELSMRNCLIDLNIPSALAGQRVALVVLPLAGEVGNG